MKFGGKSRAAMDDKHLMSQSYKAWVKNNSALFTLDMDNLKE